MSEVPTPIGADQIEMFGNDLDRLINRYIDEFDLPAATIVGVLHMKTTSVMLDAFGAAEDEEDILP